MRRILALLAFSATFAFAQTPPPPVTLTVDAAHIVGPHSATSLNTVGAGRANEGLRADWQSQLSTVQSEIGFHNLRFHGIFHDDMGVYSEDNRTGFEQNDAYTAYLHMGSPENLSPAQVAALNHAADGAPSEVRMVFVKDHRFEQTFPMHQNDTALVTLTPAQ